MLKHKKHYSLLLAFSLIFATFAQSATADVQEPLNMDQVKNINSYNTDSAKKYEEEKEAKIKLRLEAIEETALSYGALSGLVYRNWEIYNIVMKSEIVLDSVFNFSGLMIPSHYGTLIEPPIISESENAFLLGDDGMTASLTAKTYSIGENVKIVTAPRNWRDYLVTHLDLETVEAPDAVLIPKNDKEKDLWNKSIEKGWKKGVEQANDIFSEKLALLTSDFVGMIRYKKLLAQNMVSAPFAVKENRGVTGDSNEIKIDDKAVIITNSPALNKSPNNWKPTER